MKITTGGRFLYKDNFEAACNKRTFWTTGAQPNICSAPVGFSFSSASGWWGGDIAK
jgi:hypothetical protein